MGLKAWERTFLFCSKTGILERWTEENKLFTSFDRDINIPLYGAKTVLLLVVRK